VCCFLLASTLLHAQGGPPDPLLHRLRSWYDAEALGPLCSAADSAAFARFKAAASAGTGSERPPHPPEEYRLVWVEAREGHDLRILRGDGRTLAAFMEAPPLTGRGWALQPWYNGERYATFGDSPPTGLIRSEYWYFQRGTQH
jgi:hypothetical protein